MTGTYTDGMETSIDTLNQPVSERDFRKLLKQVADEQDFEVSFQVDGLGAPDGALWITTYSINNVLLDDEVKTREATMLRSLYERLDVETFDAPDDERDTVSFGVEILSPTDPTWEAFKDAVDEAVGNEPPFVTVKVIREYEAVEVGTSYGYDISGREVEAELERIAEVLRDKPGFDVGEPALSLGYASLRVTSVPEVESEK